jgi:hypothetical protein
LLTSRLSAAWANKPEAIKTIKIPAVAGVSRTVTGYVRNTVPSFANGDLRMSIVLGDTLITYQDMTTASNNAWEQFTLTFTPSITGEYSLLWEMYYAGSGSMWLDDLSIT